MRTFNLLVALFAVLQCVRYGRRALLFLFPLVQIRGEPAAPPASARRIRLGEELEELGFTPLGRSHERSPLGARRVESDAYASARRGAYADVVAEGAGPTVVFFTPFGDGAAVLTSDAPRRSVLTEQVQAGGMPDAPLPAVLAAHEVAVRRLSARHGSPAVAEELEARLAAARVWAAGEGRRELRRQHAPAFGIVLFGFLLLASAVSILLRNAP